MNARWLKLVGAETKETVLVRGFEIKMLEDRGDGTTTFFTDHLDATVMGTAAEIAEAIEAWAQRHIGP